MYRRQMHARLRDRHRGLHGRVVIVGACMEPDQIIPMNCLLKEVSLEFIVGYNRAEFKETIAAIASGKLNPKPMITDMVAVDKVPEMFAALRNPGARAKVLVEFAH